MRIRYTVLMVRKTKFYRWSAKIERSTLPELQDLAEHLGFVVATPGGKMGDPSPPALLDAVAAAHRNDPDGARLMFKTLLAAHGLLPQPPTAHSAEP